jgi:hypothetical protein
MLLPLNCGRTAIRCQVSHQSLHAKKRPEKQELGLVARVSQNEKLLLLGIGWKLIDIRKGERNKKRKFHSSLHAFSKFSSSV